MPRRGLAAIVAGALGVGALVVMPAAASRLQAPVDTAPAAPERACGAGSWVAGTTDVCGGVLVYRDYIYDDFGAAQTDFVGADCQAFPSFPRFGAYGALPTNGVAEYPPGAEGTADLVALRLRLDADDLVATAETNALFAAGQTKVVIAIDTDADGATGGGAWPGLAGVSSTGWDEVLTLTGGDAGTNLLSTRVSAPTGDRWTIRAVTAQSDGTPMNVAFRGTDDCGFWWEAQQAAMLSGGDLSSTGVTVDVVDLRDGVTRLAPTPRGRVVQRVYVSRYPVGEGVSAEGVPGPQYSDDNPPAQETSQAFTLLGRYQPYGFYLPDQPGPHGVQLLMHGLSENHSARFFLGGLAQGNIADHVGEARNRILVSPTGRGWRSWYSSYSERDVFDVVADVEATYDTDADRVFAGGYSMGGYGTLRLAALYPDRFAGYMQWVGYTGDFFTGTPLEGGYHGGALGSAVELIGNLRHVPGANLYAAADELVLLPGAVRVSQTLVDEQIPSKFYLHPTADHLTFALADDWQKESDYTAGFVRPERVDRVTYRTDESFFFPDIEMVPNRAYWVSEIDPASPGSADVDAQSFGCGARVPQIAVDRAQVGVDPVPWTATEVAVTGYDEVPAANRIELVLRNVSSLRIDVGTAHGACLAPSAVEYTVDSDRAVRIELSDGRVLAVGAGRAEGTLAAVAGPGAASDPDTLPATGGGSGAVPLAGPALLAGLALWRISRASPASPRRRRSSR